MRKTLAAIARIFARQFLPTDRQIRPRRNAVLQSKSLKRRDEGDGMALAGYGPGWGARCGSLS
jgi:hypothetical protein